MNAEKLFVLKRMSMCLTDLEEFFAVMNVKVVKGRKKYEFLYDKEGAYAGVLSQQGDYE